MVVFPSCHYSSRQQSGSTLVEVMVALLVLGMGLVGLAATQTRAVALASAGHERLQAQSLAVAVAESLRARGGGLSSSELIHWQDVAEGRLPQGQIDLVAPGPGRAGRVRVRWDNRANAGAGHQTLALVVYHR